MDYCEDSPKKKKKKKTVKSNVQALRQCIIHIRDCSLDDVSPFTDKSWKVNIFNLSCVVTQEFI